MKIYDLIKKIEQRYPLSTALNFDNTGCNIINNNDYISGILICLDVTLNAIEFANKNNINLIISHHPVIFDPIKNINNKYIVSKRIKRLIKYGINSYSLHTNFDTNIKYGMGKLFIEKLFNSREILKHSFLECFDKNHAIGDIIVLKKPIMFEKLQIKVFNNFSVSKDKGSFYNFNKKMIKKIAILPGSGSSNTNDVINEKCDCYIASDLKHNNIVDLHDAEISYINPTHFAMENIFVSYINKYLSSLTKSKIITFSCIDL